MSLLCRSTPRRYQVAARQAHTKSAPSPSLIDQKVEVQKFLDNIKAYHFEQQNVDIFERRLPLL